MNSFTCNITSTDNILGLDHSNYVQVVLKGFPSEYRYFKCKVSNFNYNFYTVDNTNNWRQNRNFYLGSDNLITSYCPSSDVKRSSNVISHMTGHGGLHADSGSEFIMENPNNKIINFQLLDSNFVLVPDDKININFTTSWILSMVVTPIEDDPNFHNLRNGL